MTQPRVETDDMGLPIVTYTTRQRVDATVSAKAPKKAMLVILASVLIVLFILYPADTSNKSANAVFGFSLGLAILALVAAGGWYLSMESHFTQNPEFETIDRRMWIGLDHGRLALIHAVPPNTWSIPYAPDLTFALGGYRHWFGDQDYAKWADEAKAADPHVIVTKDFGGNVVAVAIHEGSHAEAANIHLALTSAFVTSYARNIQIINAISQPSSDQTEAAPIQFDPDKPVSL